MLRDEQVKLIEEFAHLHETSGLQPAMAKILALLTVSDEVELTFDQIKDTLDLSKSAVSQALNQLLLTKKINYKTKIGDRKRYFHVRMLDWENQVMEHFEGITAMVNVYKRILANRTPETTEFNQGMQRLITFMSFIHNEVIAIYNKFKEQNE